MDPPKSLVFKNIQAFNVISGPQGSSSLLLYEETSPDKLEKLE